MRDFHGHIFGSSPEAPNCPQPVGYAIELGKRFGGVGDAATDQLGCAALRTVRLPLTLSPRPSTTCIGACSLKRSSGRCVWVLGRRGGRIGPVADLDGQGNRQDEVDQREDDGGAEIGRIPVQLGADDDQPQ